ncbi:Gfo/Idh/MocA family protein [Paenibacillus hamazuiensis]|uniref:Gfo/Idh/MocA family protein n=1 Tax=Paenibacillus hamazuiensis TaxID=2936508 RepID=UPI00200C08DD|nr:Gfo/Idh/MocA family oxidoreductase [Paenibacillus hamazuiensis]
MVKVALIGAGNRGSNYASYALKRPHELQVVAVAEPDAKRRGKLAELHGIPEERRFADWKQLLDQPRLADAVMICTQDHMHFDPVLQALEQGYHVLVEKPMSPEPREAIRMAEEAERRGRMLVVCHVLRYTPFFFAVKQLLAEGRIGRIVTVQWNENVGYWHQAHSFVRGHWRSSKQSSPMILAKCCHDLDLLQWLIDDECTRLSSFGGLTYFRQENAPQGAPERCIDGCPVEHECEYSALKWYYNEIDKWPQSTVSFEPTFAAREKALREGPYGKCVFRTDNDVVDHQVVSMEFAGGATVAFTMTAFTRDSSRTFKIMGTKGEILGHFEKNELEIRHFSGKTEILRPETVDGNHKGGDVALMREFVRLMNGGVRGGAKTSGTVSAQSHMLAFAAEHARVTGAAVDMKAFAQQVRHE